MFLVWPFLTTGHAPAVLEVIARQARRIVYLSSSGVNEDAERQTDPINHLHADMERLIEKSGPEWTVLRSNTIASNARGWAEQIRTGHVVRGPDIAPTAVIHEGDVTAVAVRALTDDGHAGAKHVLTGPQVLSRAEQVHAIGEAIGRPVRFEKVPVEVARRQMLADGSTTRSRRGPVGQRRNTARIERDHLHGGRDHRKARAHLPLVGGRARGRIPLGATRLPPS